MKNKKTKIFGFALLALCFACLMFGVYALKNAELTINGVVTFTAHDCIVNVDAFIEGDGYDKNAAKNDEHGEPSEKRALFTELVGGDEKAKWEVEHKITETIWFTDLTDSGEPAPIVMTFELTNKSPYKVFAEISNLVELQDKGVTVTVTSNKVYMEKANENDDTDTAILTAKFTLDDSKIDESGLMEDYSLKLNFGKYTEPAGGEEEGGDVVLNEGEVLVENDFVFKKFNDVWTLARYIGDDTIVVLPEYGPENSTYEVARYFETTEQYESVARAELGFAPSDIYGGNPEDADPARVEQLNQWVYSFMPFAQHTTLTQITISKNVTKINFSAFSGLTSLQRVIFEEGSICNEIGISVFMMAQNLTEINLPANLQTVRTMAFAYTGLTELTLPASLTTVESTGFNGSTLTLNVPYVNAESLPEGWVEGWCGYSSDACNIVYKG